MKKMLYILFLISYLFPVNEVFADVEPIPGLDTLTNNIVDTTSWVVGTLIVVLMIWLGIQFVVNMDNPSGRAQIRNKAIWAFIGLFIILSARPLSLWISALLPH